LSQISNKWLHREYKQTMSFVRLLNNHLEITMHHLILFIRAVIRRSISGIFNALLFSPLVIAGDAYSSFTHNVEGRGKDIVLIPGLMSDERVWLNTARVLTENNRIHTISIAGFGKTPAAETNTMNRLQMELNDYISKLDKPILIGHSLGGFLALSLAIDNPDRIESVISVDGLPFIGPIFTRDPNTQVSDISHQASYIRNLYANFSQKQLRAEVSKGLEIQTSTEGAKTLILDMSSSSDAETVAEMMYSVMTTDLRPSLHEIEAKVMLLGASGAMPNNAAKDQIEILYKDQLKSLPSSKVHINRNARHFIMLDDLDWMLKQINTFIGMK